MPPDKTIDTVMMIIAGGLLTMGLVSVFVGWLTRVWDRFIMSRQESVPIRAPIGAEHRSYAAEQGWEQAGTGDAEHVPVIVEQLTMLDEDELLEVLALVETADGEYRFAESRIGRFVGGRLEDRIDQVRAARGIEAALTPGRTMRVKDERGERVIPI